MNQATGSPPHIDESLLGVSHEDALSLVEGRHTNPHRILGPHAARLRDESGTVLRAFHPDATSAYAILSDCPRIELRKLGVDGLCVAFIPKLSPEITYLVGFVFPNGTTHEREDAFRFSPTVSDHDLYLFNEGTHYRLWESLGARVRTIQGVDGVGFSVWAPN